MRKYLKYIIVLIGILLFIPNKVYGANINISEVTLDSKSENVTILSDPTIDNLDINTSIKFTQINEFVKFKIDIENNDNEEYTLVNDSHSEYLSYSVENTEIKKKTTNTIYVTITLVKNVPETELDEGLLKSTIRLKFKDKEGNVVSGKNPKTQDNILNFLSILMVSIIGILIIVFGFKKNKKLLSLLIGLLLIPTLIYSANELFININLNVELEDSLILKKVGYKVIHKKQDINSDTYTIADTDNEEGIEGTEVTPSVKTYEGFTSPITQTVIIESDGSTEVEYLYTRNKYSFRISDRTYIDPTSSEDGEYQYGDEVTLKAIDREGYDFSKWSNNDTNQTTTIIIDGNTTVYPMYSAKDGIAYTVKHYKMDLDGENYTLEETENLTGTTGENVTPSVKTYEHFTSPQTETKQINGNGSTLFEYYYERNKYTLNVTDRTYLSESSTPNGDYYYESQITLSAVDRPGYTFEKWSNDLTDQTIQILLSNDLDIYPIYTANTDTAYTVKHYKMNTDGETYTLEETENLTGTTGENVTPSVKTYEHFTSPQTETKQINGNGSTLFEYYYERNKYTLNVTDRTYLSESSTPNGDYYYESQITLSAVDRPGYTFIKWSNDLTNQTLVFSMADDIEIYPIYTEKNIFVVTLNPNGGSVEPTSINVEEGDSIGELPTPTNEDNTLSFIGWYTSLEGGLEVDSSYVPNGNIEIFARWVRNNPIIYVKRQDSNEITTGDEIAIGGEHFYVVSSNENKTILLSKYNLYVGDNINIDSNDNYTLDSTINKNDEGYGLQNEIARGWVDGENKYYATVPFSGTNYWDNSVCEYNETEWNCTGDEELLLGYNGSYDGNPYPNVYRSDLSTITPVYYEDNGYELIQNNGYTISYYVEEYVERLKELGAPDAITGRLLLAEEAESLGCNIDDYSCTSSTYDWLYSSSYWLGSAIYQSGLYTIWSNNSFDSCDFYEWGELGVRPVITINTSEIEDLTVPEYTITLNANGGSVEPESITIGYDEEIGVLPTPTHEDNTYRFAGWYTSLEGGFKIDSTYVPNKNVEIFARWLEPGDSIIEVIDKQIDDRIIPGDQVSIGDEEFYVVSSDSEKTVLLSKYNLYVGEIVNHNSGYPYYTYNSTIDDNDEEYGLQNSIAKGYVNNQSIFYGIVPFSGKNYWDNRICGYVNNNYNCSGNSGLSDGYIGGYIPIGNPYPNVYRSNMNLVEPSTFYKDGYGYAEGNDYTIAYYVEEYVEKLKQIGAPLGIEGRLLFVEEAESLGCRTNDYTCSSSSYEWIYDSSYWLGSAESQWGLFVIDTDNNFRNEGHSSVTNFGVRPVIEVSTIELINNDENIISFNANGGSVEPSYVFVEEGESVGKLPIPTHENDSYTFDGWYTAIDGGIKIDSTYVPDRNIELFARWTTEPFVYIHKEDENRITPGDEVAFDGEQFYVVSANSEKTVLLSKYNLYVGDIYKLGYDNYDGFYYHDYDSTINKNDSKYGLQSSLARGWYVHNRLYNYGIVAFSGTNYWDNSVCLTNTWNCTGDSGLLSEYTGNYYDGNPYPNVYRSDMSLIEPVYDYDYGRGYAQNNGYTISYYVEEYVNKLKQLGAPSTITGRLILEEEVENLGCRDSYECPETIREWLLSSSYWMGSANDDRYIYVAEYSDYDPYGYLSNSSFGENRYGVRPVIEVSTINLVDSNSHYVKYNANGGSVEPSYIIIKDGESVGELPEPAFDEWHIFDGWYTSLEGGIEVDETYIPKGNDELFAHWVVIPHYTITFNSNGGNEIEDKKIAIDDPIGELPLPIRDLYGFTGWYTGIEEGTEIDETYVPTGDMELFARWYYTCKGFDVDSWETIKENVKDDISYYGIGCLKTIDMGTFTYTLRIANNTTPAECEANGFSQTACGFVVEFEDIMTTHIMNPYSNSGNTNGDGNRGGWANSEVRTYVNNDIYNALPNDLKRIIDDTVVVSGHGNRDSANFTTTDKLYLLSTHEVSEDTDGNIDYGISYYDSAYDNTRQLDYYKSKGVTDNRENQNYLIKKQNDNGVTWWLRSSYKDSNNGFYNIDYYGNMNANFSSNSFGISPAFRLYTGIMYNVTLNANGGSVSQTEIRVKNGNPIGELPIPNNDDITYHFDGWYTAIDGGIKVDNDYIINEDIELFARWEKNKFKFINRQDPNKIISGDEVKIGSEQFYVVSSNSNKTVLLAKYNLYVGQIIEDVYDSNLQENKFILKSTINPSSSLYGWQNSIAGNNRLYLNETFYGAVPFSSKGYWDYRECYIGQNFQQLRCSSNNGFGLKPEYGRSYNPPDNNIYRSDLNSNKPNISFANNSGGVALSNDYTIAYYVEEYVERLKQLGAPSTITGRLLLAEESANLGCSYTSVCVQGFKEWAYSSAYWLGSAFDELNVCYIYVGGPMICGRSFESSLQIGVRPVIEVNTSDIDENDFNTIQFNANGGWVDNVLISIIKTKPIGELPIPINNDETKIFEGWYLEDTFENKVDNTYVPTGDITLNAKWVTDIDNANITNTSLELTVEEEETINITNSNEIEEYTFSSNDESVATVDSSGLVTGIGEGTTTIILTGTLSGKTIEVNVTVGPKITKYTVTLNANGGSVSPEYIEVDVGSQIGELPTPTPEDEFHEFDGWYTAITGGTEITSSYVPKGNIEIFARWNDLCKGFSTASWSTIQTNVNNDLGYYEVGCTKSVSLGSNLGTHTLRVANNTRPAECETSGFSQTACGFVIEFEDIITTHIMNPYSNNGNSNGDGNKGGWEYSDMRAYVNSGKYLEGTENEIDYTSNGIYNALPNELKNIIIDTYVVSGYGYNDSSNFTTTDKLYLFSPHEIWIDVDGNTSDGIDYNDKSYSNTRQLDYYASKSVTVSNRTNAIKKYGTSNGYVWRLRSASYKFNSHFLSVNLYGGWDYYYSHYSYGVSPSFRIASGGKYRVTLNANGGSVDPEYKEVVEGREVGVLPVPTNEDTTLDFVGWYTDLTGGMEVTSSYVPEENIEIFARWSELCKGFSTASWSTIKINVNNDLGYYEVGCTKSVDLGTFGTHTLRVANNTRPAECETSGFSQTACGFVVEFEDVISTHRMNPYSNSGNSNGDGNRGGWEYSEMRAYVNSGKYLEGTANEIDYTSNGIYNALPSELKNVIIDTYVVSGHGQNDSSNFTTTDKLYLFSPHEIWNDVDENTSSGIDYYDKSYSNTRQLDYYASKSVTTSKYTNAIKKRNGSASYWWLRSAHSTGSSYFFAVHNNGSWHNLYTQYSYGVAPSFRIASGEKYRVELNANGGSVTPTYIDVTVGNQIGELPTPTPEDEFHKFEGWYTAIDGGIEITSSYVPTGDIELFARWKEYKIVFKNRQVDDEITIGDEIAIGSEHFYVVSNNNDKTVLLSKYNLYVGDNYTTGIKLAHMATIEKSDPNYGLQNEIARGQIAGEVADEYGIVSFAGTNYWDSSEYVCACYSDNVTCYSRGNTGLLPSYTGSYSGNPYPNIYRSDINSAPIINYEVNYNYVENSEYSIAYYVEEYVERLKELGAPNSITGRLLLYEEIMSLKCDSNDNNCNNDINDWLFYSTYYLGSAYNHSQVWYAATNGSIYNIVEFNQNIGSGVRPVIEINTSDLQ